MSQANFMLTTFGAIFGGLSLEHFLLRKKVPQLYDSSEAVPALPRSYGAVILVNVVGSTVTLIILGFKVAKARDILKQKAIKDGDQDAEARFSYPKIYAEGFSEHARVFNCIQRGHQQAFETYPMFLALSLIGGIRYPITTIVGGSLWNYARLKWAEGYSCGDPKKRYDHWASKGIWSGLFVQLIAAGATAVQITLK